MAQSTSSTALRSCRVCRHYFQRLSIQQRSFSSTPQVQKTIPAFHQTSSTELDTLLSEIRDKIFVPEIVSPTQRKLIYKPARQPILLNDPGVYFTTPEGEDIRLQPLDIHDRPRKHQSLHKILSLMKESEDWENLPRLLEGLKLSKQEPQKLGWWNKMIRKAGEARRIDVIIRCAEMGERTHLWFTSKAVIGEVIPLLHNDAVAAGWKGDGLDAVIKHLERAVRIIEGTASTRKLKEGEVDYRKRPEVAGLLLELYATKALNDFGGKDQDGKVADTATKLDAMWNFGDYSINKEHPSSTLSFLIPMWNGVRQALKLDIFREGKNAQVGAKLQQNFGELDAVINEARDACVAEAQGKQRRGLLMYNNVA